MAQSTIHMRKPSHDQSHVETLCGLISMTALFENFDREANCKSCLKKFDENLDRIRKFR